MTIVFVTQPTIVLAEEAVTMHLLAAGNSISGATNILIGTTYNGNITASNTVDYYKFTLNSATKITFIATAKMESICYYLYDSSGNQLWRKYASWNQVTEKSDTSESIDLSAGTYYAAIEREGDCTGSYTFKIATHTHSYKEVITKVTTSSNGKIEKICSCGTTNGTSIIYAAKNLTLSKNSYTYDGRIKKPSVTVKGSNGATISPFYYTVSYSGGRKMLELIQ